MTNTVTSGIMIQVCRRCNTRHFPPHLSCAECGGAEWGSETSLAGYIQEITVLRRRAGAADAEPVTIVQVRSDAGPIIIARGTAGMKVGDRIGLACEGTTPLARTESVSGASIAYAVIDQDDINAYARVSNDFNPIHVEVRSDAGPIIIARGTAGMKVGDRIGLACEGTTPLARTESVSGASIAYAVIDQDDINAYARVSNDFNPIHVDPVFARTTAYGGTIAHGTMSSALIARHLTERISADQTIRRLSLKFVGPIHSGDRLSCTVEQSPSDGEMETVFAVSTINQHGKTVAVGEAGVTRRRG